MCYSRGCDPGKHTQRNCVRLKRLTRSSCTLPVCMSSVVRGGQVQVLALRFTQCCLHCKHNSVLRAGCRGCKPHNCSKTFMCCSHMSVVLHTRTCTHDKQSHQPHINPSTTPRLCWTQHPKTYLNIHELFYLNAPSRSALQLMSTAAHEAHPAFERDRKQRRSRAARQTTRNHSKLPHRCGIREITDL